MGVAYADIPASLTNQTYDGATIKAGTYFNTAGHMTTFTNTAGTGITLNAGNNIRGVEIFNGAYTGNGGRIYIHALDQVVRLNGNIDVRGFLPNGKTGLPGNGGSVQIDAGYVYQNGNIYAGGFNGGSVLMNVNGMTMGPGALIDATGQLGPLTPYNVHQVGYGGNVYISSTGKVQINKGAVIRTSGAPRPAYTELNPLQYHPESNSIEIAGSAVNMDGVALADHLENSAGGVIRLFANSKDGDVNIGKTGTVQSGGEQIIITSQRDVNNAGLILSNGTSFTINDPASTVHGVNGGLGGMITVTAARNIQQTGRIQSDGAAASGGWNYPEDNSGAGYSGHYGGSSGGVITLSAKSIYNSGVIRGIGGHSELGHGGNGARITFNGVNPTGNGAVVALSGLGVTNGAPGTITAPDPATSSNTFIGLWKKSLNLPQANPGYWLGF